MGHGRCWSIGLLSVIASATAGGALASPGQAATTSRAAFRPAPGSPVSVGAGPTAVAFSPDGRFLAVADYQLSAVAMYAVSDSGRLSRVPGSPFPTGTGPVAVAFNPTGRTLLVADYGADELSVESVDAAGRLTPSNRSPYRLAGAPYDVTYSPGGGLIATADSSGDAFQLLTARGDGTPGTVNATHTLPVGTDPTSIAFSPDGRLLAVSEHGAAAVAAYRLGSTGPVPTLSPLPGSPATTASPADTISFNRESTLLAASDYDGAAVDLLSIGTDDTLGPTAAGNVATGPGSGPDSAEFSPVNDQLAVALGTANRTAFYGVTTTSTPSPLPGSPLMSGTGPTALGFNPQGTLLATANIYSNTVSVYAATGPKPAVLRLLSARGRVSHRRVPVRVGCAGVVDHSAGHLCRGRLTLADGSARVGAASFAIPPGQTRTLTVTLAEALVRRTTGRRLVTLRASASASGAHTVSRALTVSS